jgi:hypothetical protein
LVEGRFPYLMDRQCRGEPPRKTQPLPKLFPHLRRSVAKGLAVGFTNMRPWSGLPVMLQRRSCTSLWCRPADEDQVVGVGRASLGPVLDVMGLQVMGSAAAREPAPPVAPAELAAEPRGPLCSIPPADHAGWSAETAFDGPRPHPGCSEIFLDRLTALCAVGEAKNFELVFRFPPNRHSTWWLRCGLERQG